MARLRFGDQSVPKVTRVAAGGGGGSLGGMSDVDLTDTSQGGLADGAVLVYDVVITSGSGIKSRVLEGSVSVLEGVTL